MFQVQYVVNGILYVDEPTADREAAQADALAYMANGQADVACVIKLED